MLFFVSFSLLTSGKNELQQDYLNATPGVKFVFVFVPVFEIIRIGEGIFPVSGKS